MEAPNEDVLMFLFFFFPPVLPPPPPPPLPPPSAGSGPAPSADDPRVSPRPADSGGGCGPAGLPHAPWLQLQARLQ